MKVSIQGLDQDYKLVKNLKQGRGEFELIMSWKDIWGALGHPQLMCPMCQMPNIWHFGTPNTKNPLYEMFQIS